MGVLINGKEYGYSDCEISLNGKRYGGISEINYKHGREVEASRGSESYPLGFPRGKYTGVEGSMKILRRVYNQMVADVGHGYLEMHFDWDVTCAPKGLPACTDSGNVCTWTDEDFSKQDDGESEYVTREFKGLWLVVNGFKPVAGLPD